MPIPQEGDWCHLQSILSWHVKEALTNTSVRQFVYLNFQCKILN